jgi:replicative DNA helicase
MSEESAKNPRIEPRNAEAEASCLGAILLEKGVYHRVREFISADDFYLDRHRHIFQAVEDLMKGSVEIDLVTLTNHLRNNKLLERCGGPEYLSDIVASVPSTLNVEHYAKIVREKAQLRSLIRAAREIINKSFDESLEVRGILDDAEKEILDISKREVSNTFQPIRLVVGDSVKKMMEMADSHKKITGLPTGYDRLDSFTDGFHDAEFIIIAARPSMGKTALAMNIAENMSIDGGLGVAIFSMEMPRDQITLRMLSSQSLIPPRKIKSWYLNDEEKERIINTADRLSGANLFIDDSSTLTVFDVRARLRRLMADHKIHAVFIDYIQLMSQPGFKDNKQQQVAEISRSLKAMAREMRIPVVALSQMNRKVDDRETREPQLSDLKESGALEQDADLVIFIHRDDYYKKRKEQGKPAPGEQRPDDGPVVQAEIIVGKNRNGPVGSFPLNFDKEHTKFVTVEREQAGAGQE